MTKTTFSISNRFDEELSPLWNAFLNGTGRPMPPILRGHQVSTLIELASAGLVACAANGGLTLTLGGVAVMSEYVRILPTAMKTFTDSEVIAVEVAMFERFREPVEMDSPYLNLAQAAALNGWYDEPPKDLFYAGENVSKANARLPQDGDRARFLAICHAGAKVVVDKDDDNLGKWASYVVDFREFATGMGFDTPELAASHARSLGLTVVERGK